MMERPCIGDHGPAPCPFLGVHTFERNMAAYVHEIEAYVTKAQRRRTGAIEPVDPSAFSLLALVCLLTNGASNGPEAFAARKFRKQISTH